MYTTDAFKNRYNSAKKSLLKRDDIDEVTRQEILQVLGNNPGIVKGPNFGGAQKKNINTTLAGEKLLEKAKEGVDMKFKSRKATELMYKTMFDQGDSKRLRGGQMDFGSILRV